jgi:hypothetical protein
MLGCGRAGRDSLSGLANCLVYRRRVRVGTGFSGRGCCRCRHPQGLDSGSLPPKGFFGSGSPHRPASVTVPHYCGSSPESRPDGHAEGWGGPEGQHVRRPGPPVRRPHIPGKQGPALVLEDPRLRRTGTDEEPGITVGPRHAHSWRALTNGTRTPKASGPAAARGSRRHPSATAAPAASNAQARAGRGTHPGRRQVGAVCLRAGDVMFFKVIDTRGETLLGRKTSDSPKGNLRKSPKAQESVCGPAPSPADGPIGAVSGPAESDGSAS